LIHSHINLIPPCSVPEMVIDATSHLDACDSGDLFDIRPALQVNTNMIK
jgi:hypothetical protein